MREKEEIRAKTDLGKAVKCETHLEVLSRTIFVDREGREGISTERQRERVRVCMCVCKSKIRDNSHRQI